jgi:alkaline phosphatase
MKSSLLSLILALTLVNTEAQVIFAHNDYLKSRPFDNAFELKAAYIETDVFLEDKQLLVAHTKKEIHPAKTLESMYVRPLSEKVKEGQGKLYGLTLMIDLKTEGASTMDALIKIIERYPELKTCQGLSITMSGNYPPPGEWKNYPAWITFDGRPNVSYNDDQKKKLRLISTDFKSVSTWDGKGEIPSKDETNIKAVVVQAHNLNLPVRLWASPDFPNAWDKLTVIGVDILNSDNINELSKHLGKH